MKRYACVGALLSAGWIAYGCGGSAPSASAPSGSLIAVSSRSCARLHPGTGPSRATIDRQGGAVALAKLGDRSIAYVADADSQAIHTVDVDRGAEIADTPIDGEPSNLLVLADGRVAVTLKDKAELAVFEPSANADQALDLRCTADTPAEPVGITLTPDDSTLLVASAWGRALTAMDSEDLVPKFAVDLKRDARSVVVDDAGQRAFVSHGVGADVSVVDLTGKHDVRPIDLRVTKVTAQTEDKKPRTGSQAYVLVKSVGGIPPVETEGQPPVEGKAPQPKPATKAPAPPPVSRIFVPMVTVDPGDPNVRSQAYYGPAFDGVPKEAPIVAVLDPDAERSLTKTKLSLGTPLTRECLLPRAAAYRASTGALYVACAGIDSLLELDTRGSDPVRLETRRFNVPAGPMGVAVDDTKGRAVVWSQFDGEVSIVDLDTAERARSVRIVTVSYEPKAWVKDTDVGRRLFFGTDDKRVANDGVGCASCHPDGRDDSITWSTPEGPRQTIMLAGRLPETEPYGWVGKHGDLKTYVQNTFSRLGGEGMDDESLGQLIAYLKRLPGPGHVVPASAETGDLASRGRELFFEAKTGCSSCHSVGLLTDKSVHDVGSKDDADVSVGFDTPSLRFLEGSAPYFHDGRYATLDDLLSATDSEMGHTAQLNKPDRDALKAFLETL